MAYRHTTPTTNHHRTVKGKSKLSLLASSLLHSQFLYNALLSSRSLSLFHVKPQLIAWAHSVNAQLAAPLPSTPTLHSTLHFYVTQLSLSSRWQATQPHHQQVPRNPPRTTSPSPPPLQQYPTNSLPAPSRPFPSVPYKRPTINNLHPLQVLSFRHKKTTINNKLHPPRTPIFQRKRHITNNHFPLQARSFPHKKPTTTPPPYPPLPQPNHSTPAPPLLSSHPVAVHHQSQAPNSPTATPLQSHHDDDPRPLPQTHGPSPRL
jgi:hypothetical protein